MLHELFRPAVHGGSDAPSADTPGAWEATIAAVTPDGAEVVISGFDTDRRWGPCPYEPRVALDDDDALYLREPVRGDRALVVFDDNREPWVVCWWPV
jgi:hypothetical protein